MAVALLHRLLLIIIVVQNFLLRRGQDCLTMVQLHWKTVTNISWAII